VWEQKSSRESTNSPEDSWAGQSAGLLGRTVSGTVGQDSQWDSWAGQSVGQLGRTVSGTVGQGSLPASVASNREVFGAFLHP
jgi:hypothetical protein